jgi:hypothetical protein
MYFRQATVPIPLYHVQPFLQTFFPNATAEAICTLRVDNTACEPKDDPVIDMLWLLSFLLDHPSIKISFHGADKFKYVVLNLKDLVKIARIFPAWRLHLDSAFLQALDPDNLVPWPRQRHLKVLQTAPTVALKFFFKTEHVQAWWDNEGQRYQKTQQMLSDLGVLTANMNCFGHYRNSIACLLMHGFQRKAEDMNTYHESRAGWHR